MAKRETVITKEIAILEKTLAKAPEKVKIKIRAKIARLKKEAKGIPMTAKQLANNVLRQKQKIIFTNYCCTIVQSIFFSISKHKHNTQFQQINCMVLYCT